MKVLLANHHCNGLGAGYNRTISIAKALNHFGIEAQVFVASQKVGHKPITYKHHGIRITEFPGYLPIKIKNAGLNLFEIINRISLIKKNGVDIYHGINLRPTVFYPGHIAQKQMNIPFISDWGDIWGWSGLASNRNLILKYTLGIYDNYTENNYRCKANGLTVVSKFLYNKAIELGCSKDFIRVIPPGAPDEEIYPHNKKKVRQKYNLPLNGKIIIYSALYLFDLELLLTLFSQVLKRDNNVFLVLIGNDNTQIRKLIQKYHTEENVFHLGFHYYNSLGQVLSTADLMIIPLSRDPYNYAKFPNRFGEALAAGLPIVSVKYNDMASIVQEEKIGLILQDDPGQASEEILHLLNSPTDLKEMSIKARYLGETSHSWRNRAEVLIRFYNKILNDH